jgi:hypothetical protein
MEPAAKKNSEVIASMRQVELTSTDAILESIIAATSERRFCSNESDCMLACILISDDSQVEIPI